MVKENENFLSEQIITYLGNKRTLICEIEKEIEVIKKTEAKHKLICGDLFAGSGIVSRMLKKHCKALYVNDLENYSRVINECYLSNQSDYPKATCDEYRKQIIKASEKTQIEGIIAQNYAPKNDENIQKEERVFYTRSNALLIDSFRTYIDEIVKEESLKKFFLAPLITEASIKVNTSGVFKGFYKDKSTGKGCFGGEGRNALSRILKPIELKAPVLSNFECNLHVLQEDAVLLAKTLPQLDVVYLDPPYNQHPYGSNYFMLNLILKNKLDTEISKVSGITKCWNRSVFNRQKTALLSLEQIISTINSQYIITSYNSEGFITLEQMENMLSNYGKLKTISIPYNTFRGSRNLAGRDIHVSEYLFVLKKY